MMEFHHTTQCPFCGVDYTTLWFKGKAITAIKHPRFEQDRECRGTVAVDPVHGRGFDRRSRVPRRGRTNA